MSQIQNQFKQSTQKGLLDLRFNPTIVSAQVDVSELGLLVPGQAVKRVDVAGGIPKVIACASDADDVFGVLIYNIKNKTYKALDAVELVVSRTSVIYLEAGGPIAANGKVMIQVAGSKVVAAVGAGKVVLGRAFDKAAADGNLIRVTVDLPGEVLP